MSPRINRVRYLKDHQLELGFTNGFSGAIDLRDRVVGRGGVFCQLEDVAFFKQVQVDEEAGTIVWPNGVDLCPDDLYSLSAGKPIRALEPA